MLGRERGQILPRAGMSLDPGIEYCRDAADEQFKSAMAASREAAESILDVYRTELQKHLESRQRGGN